MSVMELPLHLVLRCIAGDDLMRLVRHLKGITDDPHADFTAALPLITGAQNEVRLNTPPSPVPAYSVSHDIEGAYTLRLNESGRSVCSIVTSGDVLRITLTTSFPGDQDLLELDKTFFQASCDKDGFLDLMSFITALPECESVALWLRIYAEPRANVTVWYSEKSKQSLWTRWMSKKPKSWECMQVQTCRSLPIFPEGIAHYQATLQPHFISSGLMICCEVGKKLAIDVIRSILFELIIHRLGCDEQVVFSSKVHGLHLRRGNHYFINLADRVNFSRIDRVRLNIEFHELFVGAVNIYNCHKNVLQAAHGMLAWRFAF